MYSCNILYLRPLFHNPSRQKKSFFNHQLLSKNTSISLNKVLRKKHKLSFKQKNVVNYGQQFTSKWSYVNAIKDLYMQYQFKIFNVANIKVKEGINFNLRLFPVFHKNRLVKIVQAKNVSKSLSLDSKETKINNSLSSTNEPNTKITKPIKKPVFKSWKELPTIQSKSATDVIRREELNFSEAISFTVKTVQDFLNIQPEDKSQKLKEHSVNKNQLQNDKVLHSRKSDLNQEKLEQFQSRSDSLRDKHYISPINENSEESSTSSSLSNLDNIRNLSEKALNLLPSFKSNASSVTDSYSDLSYVTKRELNERTRGLILSLLTAKSNVSKVKRLENFCRHLTKFPHARILATKEQIISILLRIHSSGHDPAVKELSLQALALVGWTQPVRGRGIRILSLDGGGTRGLVSIQLLRSLQEMCGDKPLHELFDYICGVSTGSLIAVMLAVYRVSISDFTQIYQDFSREMFNRSRIVGTGRLVTSHAYYDSQLWEKILRENIGERSFLETAKDPSCAKLALVSTITNAHKAANFLFRNYRLPPGIQSHYHGSMEYKLWEAIRASSAAPAYFEEFKLGDLLHQDGGLMTNNPTAIAIHECKQIWPSDKIQCVISVGTGRYDPHDQSLQNVQASSLREKIKRVVESATDTEAVHTVINDLLPPSTYFRFNPHLSELFSLDEVRAEKWEIMESDTKLYCRQNEAKFHSASDVLTRKKQHHQHLMEFLQNKMDRLGKR